MIKSSQPPFCQADVSKREIMLKKRNVVMLATNQKAENCLLLQNGRLSYCRQYLTQSYLKETNRTAFHLYITSDEEIKEGDWCIRIEDNKLIQCKPNKGKSIATLLGTSDYGDIVQLNKGSFKNGKAFKKIIATTDSSLKQGLTGLGETAMCSLPKPSQAFIEVFIEEYNKGNVITEVMVEYQQIATYITGEPCTILKLSKDNTITIKKVKNSWNRDEIILKLNHLYSDLTTDSNYNGVFFDKWIEENL